MLATESFMFAAAACVHALSCSLSLSRSPSSVMRKIEGCDWMNVYSTNVFQLATTDNLQLLAWGSSLSLSRSLAISLSLSLYQCFKIQLSRVALTFPFAKYSQFRRRRIWRISSVNYCNLNTTFIVNSLKNYAMSLNSLPDITPLILSFRQSNTWH